jgi:hypothetical protein
MLIRPSWDTGPSAGAAGLHDRAVEGEHRLVLTVDDSIQPTASVRAPNTISSPVAGEDQQRWSGSRHDPELPHGQPVQVPRHTAHRHAGRRQ